MKITKRYFILGSLFICILFTASPAKAVTIEELQLQIQQLQQQIQAIDAQMEEIEGVVSGLDQLKTSKIGSEILVPLHAGIFVKAELKQTDELSWPYLPSNPFLLRCGHVQIK